MGGATGEKSAEVSSAAENSAGEAQTTSGAAENGAEEVSAVEGSSAENTVSDPNVLLDNEWAKITLTGKLEEPDIGYSVMIENTSEQYITVAIKDSSVDGLMTGFYFRQSHVAPGKKLKTEMSIFADNPDIKSPSDLKNIEGNFWIAVSKDGEETYVYQKEKYPFTIPDNTVGAGAEAAEIETVGADGGEVKQTDYVKIEGIYVDNSHFAINNMKLVYVFADMFTNAENIQVSSVGSELTINDANSYPSNKLNGKAQSMIDSYYYNSTNTPIYIGNSKKVLSTFLVPAAELEAGRSITMNLYGIPDTDKIKMSTNDIVFCDSEDEIAQKADPEGYAKIQPADAETVEKVKQAINGKGFDMEVNGTLLSRYVFKSPDKFESQGASGMRLNGGTYTVEAGYIACKFDAMLDVSGNKVGEGTTFRIPWKWGDNGIELDLLSTLNRF